MYGITVHTKHAWGKSMRFFRFHHKGVRQFYEDDFDKGVPPAMADKLRKLLFAMETAESLEMVAFTAGSFTRSKANSKGSGALR
jgi:proteic killer suppression protein